MAGIVVGSWRFPDPDALGVVVKKTANFVEVRFRISDISTHEDNIHNANWQPPPPNTHYTDISQLNVGDLVQSGDFSKVIRVEPPHVFVKYNDGDAIFLWNPDNNNNNASNNSSNNGSNNNNNVSNNNLSNNGNNNNNNNGNNNNNNPSNLHRNNNNANNSNNPSIVVEGGRRKTRKPRKGRKGKKSRRGRGKK